jgi:hypothetical protein
MSYSTLFCCAESAAGIKAETSDAIVLKLSLKPALLCGFVSDFRLEDSDRAKFEA